MKKRITAITLIVCFLLIGVLPVYAAGEVIIPVFLDGKRVNFGTTNNKQDNAIIIHDYAYVPIAKIVQLLTGKVPDWDDKTKTASFVFNNKSYAIKTNENGIYVNNVFINSATGTPPVIVNDRTLIPLKMLTAVMGFSQNYSAAERSTYLTSPVITSPPSTTPVNPTPPTTPVTLPAELPVIIRIDPDKEAVKSGESITMTITANSSTYMVKVTDQKNYTIAETKSYRPDKNNNIFELTFFPPVPATYNFYAGSSENYAGSVAKPIAVSFSTPLKPVIHNVFTEFPTVYIGKNLKMTVITSTDVTSVAYSISSGGGSMSAWTLSSGFTDNQGARTWTNTYTAPGSTGEKRILVSARTDYGGEVSVSYVVNAVDILIDVNEFAAEVLRLTNIERKDNELPDLSGGDSALRAAAFIRADELTEKYEHTRPDGRDPFTAYTDLGRTYTAAGENIARGQTSPEAVVKSWMDSDIHKENILNPNFTHIGVGASIDKDGRICWVQLFIR